MTHEHHSPMEKIESQFEELVSLYGEGEKKELRVAAKMLLVALDRFRRHGGPHWDVLAQEYLDIAKREPDKFDRILQGNRSASQEAC